MVDLYKKLLVGQLDLQTLEVRKNPADHSFGEETGAQAEGGEAALAKDAAEDPAGGSGMNWKPAFPLNPSINEYGDKDAEIVAFNILDQEGNSSNTIEKGTRCTIAMKVLFHKPVNDPIFAFTITDLKGTDITGTNSLFEKVSVRNMKAGQTQEISFTQNMDMQGGEYMLSLGCTGYNGVDFVVHHRLYEACNLTIVSVKNTVGFYDTNSVVTLLN